MKQSIFNYRWLLRFTAILLGFTCCTLVHAANTSKDYYYKVTARTGGHGKIYLSETSTNNPSYQTNTMTKSDHVDGYRIAGTDYSETRYFYFYATPNEGYRFDGWYNTSNNGKVSDNSSFTAELYPTSTNSNNPDALDYTAKFVAIPGQVKVYTNQPQRGSCEIDNEENEMGDEVTITAHPDASQGILFEGWKLNNTGELITDNPYTFTVDATTKGTYYAYFTEPSAKIYCILKNKDTGNYLCIDGEKTATAHEITKTVSSVTKTVQDGFIFGGGLKTISDTEAKNNPMIVFKFLAQNVNTPQPKGYLSSDVDMSSGGKIAIQSLIGGNTQYPLVFSSQGDGIYRIYTTIHVVIKNAFPYVNEEFDLNSYLCEDGNSVLMKSLDGNASISGIDWEVIYLTESQDNGAFPVSAKAQQGDYYYTSMYAPFAYKLLDGVKAYYLDLVKSNFDDNKNIITLTEVEAKNGQTIVPANKGVILECEKTDGNMLLPVEVKASEYVIEGHHPFRGYNKIFKKSGNSYAYTSVANNDKIYVFAYSKGRLGFFRYSGSVIPPNKVYVELPVPLDELSTILSTEADENSIKFAFGQHFDDGDFNSIDLSNEVIDDADDPIYNLQGVQVTNPEKGIYIRGGKKYLVK